MAIVAHQSNWITSQILLILWSEFMRSSTPFKKPDMLNYNVNSGFTSFNHGASLVVHSVIINWEQSKRACKCGV